MINFTRTNDINQVKQFHMGVTFAHSPSLSSPPSLPFLSPSFFLCSTFTLWKYLLANLVQKDKKIKFYYSRLLQNNNNSSFPFYRFFGTRFSNYDDEKRKKCEEF
jgi:hypothetical protein